MASGYAARKMRFMERKGLKKARKRAKLKQEAIAERMGVSIAQVSRWENGHDGIPSQRIASMAAAYEASLEELFEGEDVAAVSAAVEPNARVLKYEGASEERLVRDLPVYGTSLGAPQDFDGQAIEQTMLNSGETIEYLQRPVLLNGNAAAYGLYVQGSSMAPRHKDGETILVTDSRRGRPPGIGDDVVVYLRDIENDDGERAVAVLVKTLVRRTGSFIELEQYTPHITFQIDASRVLRIDRVIPWSELLS